MNKSKVITIVGVALSGAGAVLSIASGIVSDMKMKEEITKQVAEAVAKIEK